MPTHNTIIPKPNLRGANRAAAPEPLQNSPSNEH